MDTDDTYRTISANSKGVYRDKASKFISIACPVGTEDEAKEILRELRKEYFDANHHCWAYRIGTTNVITRFNDDGEPSGSAGKPILGQILSMELTHVLVVVIRYFGGTKLGIPGLVRAYKTAAREALENAPVAVKTINESYELLFDYTSMNEIMRMLKEEKAEMYSRDFGNTCRISFSVRRNRTVKIKSRLDMFPEKGKIILKKI
jgi:uncharacterized YigZ family protein